MGRIQGNHYKNCYKNRTFSKQLTYCLVDIHSLNKHIHQSFIRDAVIIDFFQLTNTKAKQISYIFFFNFQRFNLFCLIFYQKSSFFSYTVLIFSLVLIKCKSLKLWLEDVNILPNLFSQQVISRFLLTFVKTVISQRINVNKLHALLPFPSAPV